MSFGQALESNGVRLSQEWRAPSRDRVPGHLAEVDLERLARAQQRELVDPHHLLSHRHVKAAQASRDGSLLMMHCARSAGELYLEPVDAYTVAVLHDSSLALHSWTPSGGFTNGRMFQGDAVMIPVGEPAYLKLAAHSNVTILFARPQLLFSGLREGAAEQSPPVCAPRMAARTGARDAVLRCIAYAMAGEAADKSQTSSSMINTAGAALAAHLLAHYRDQSDAPRGPLSKQHQTLIVNYINARLDREVRLDDLADLTGFSTSHFAHLFKATLGVPPMRYVHTLKMQRARELIDTTAMTIAEVGISVGYDDPAHFSRTFRAHWRVAPSSLRRQRA